MVAHLFAPFKQAWVFKQVKKEHGFGGVGVVGVVGVAMSTAVCSLGSSGWIGLSSPNEVESMCVCVCVELVYRNWKEE